MKDITEYFGLAFIILCTYLCMGGSPALAEDIISKKEARNLWKTHHQKQAKRYWLWCKRGVNHQIRERAKRGHLYVHITKHSCWGLDPERMKKELEKKGFSVNLQTIKIKDVDYSEVISVAWRK